MNTKTHEIERLTLPARWGSALINGDFSSFSAGVDQEANEIQAIQQILVEEGKCLGLVEDSVVDFERGHDAVRFGIGATNCASFVFAGRKMHS